MPEGLTATKQIEAFALSVADIRSVEPQKLHALSLSVRWPHRPEDWAFLLRVGEGVAALDEIGRVLATAMWFAQGDRFATLGMVITSPRLQTLGAGHWLMQHALGRLGARDLGLNATRAAERLYLSLGFRPAATVFQHQGLARAVAPPALREGATLRALGRGDHAAILALDGQAAGHDRGTLLADLCPRAEVLGLFRQGALRAFAFCRPFGRGRLIGPVVAFDDEDAMAVAAPHLAAQAGGFVRLDTRREAGAFTAMLDEAGLALFDTVRSMSLGRPWPPAGSPAIYGLAAQATG